MFQYSMHTNFTPHGKITLNKLDGPCYGRVHRTQQQWRAFTPTLKGHYISWNSLETLI